MYHIGAHGLQKKISNYADSDVMYWGMLMPNGLIALKKIMRNINSNEYINLLKHYAVPLMKLNRTENFQFIQDNCPAHKSRKATKFLKDHNINVLEWPARSPDINLERLYLIGNSKIKLK